MSVFSLTALLLALLSALLSALADGPAPNPLKLPCREWTALLHSNNVFNKVQQQCNAHVDKPPCDATASPAGGQFPLEYLYLGEVGSLADCQSAATNLKLIQGSPTQKAAAAAAAKAGIQMPGGAEPQLACCAVTWFR